MWGTFFNVGMIFLGSAVGSIFKKGLGARYHRIVMQALGLCALMIGLNSTLTNMQKSQLPVLFIVSLVTGGVIGQALKLEDRFDQLTARLGGSRASSGLSTGILLFCVGSLSILGPFEAALNHNYTYLLTNGLLDGITSIILASAYGWVIALCGVVLLIWQGSLYLCALFFASAISPALMAEVSIVGGILIFVAGLNILKLTKISVLNLLPSLLIPPLVLLFWH